jgi:hypothetical protein
VDTVNDACAQRLGQVLSLPPEQLAEATKDLAALFPGAQPAPATGPAAPPNHDDESDPVVADINRMIYGDGEEDDDEDDEDDQEPENELDQVEAAPSGNRFNGANRSTEAGPRPLPNGGNERAFKQGPQPSATGATGVAPGPERTLKNGMGRRRPKKGGSPPSTNSNRPPGSRNNGDRNGNEPRRCA